MLKIFNPTLLVDILVTILIVYFVGESHRNLGRHMRSDYVGRGTRYRVYIDEGVETQLVSV